MRVHNLITSPTDAGQNLEGTEESRVSEHIAQNIEAVCAVYARAEEGVLRHQRIVESLSSFVGRAGFAYALFIFIALWSLLNLLLPTPFDPPPFTWLQGIITTCALLVSTVVVITQHRHGRLNDQRAHLELQIALLAEQKIAKVIGLIEELRRDLPSVKNRFDPEAAVMEKPADPHLVLSALEEGFQEASESTGPSSDPVVPA